MSYSEPIYQTYTVLANASLSTAAVAKRFIGPIGKQGRIVDCSAIITTGTTTNPSTIIVGTAGDTDSIFTMTVPVLAADAGHVATEAEISAAATLAADTVYLMSGGGEADAGAADITLTIAWF